MKKIFKALTIVALISGYITGTMFLASEAQAVVWLDPSDSTVTASAGSAPADNENYVVISVNAVGTNGLPFVGQSAALFSSRDSDTITTLIGTTNSTGLAVFRVKSSVAGSSIFRATIGGSEINQRVRITFTAVIFPVFELLASATNSTVVASPNTVPANNINYSTITVTTKNNLNAPVSGVLVSMASSRDSDTVTAVTSTTNSSGVATFRVKSSTAGTSNVRAIIYGTTIIDQRATIAFTAVVIPHFDLPVFAANSTVVASPMTIVANNTNYSNITVTAKNSVNGAVDISTIVLTSSRGGKDHITVAEPLVAVANQRYFRITSGIQGVSTITAVVNGITLSPVNITFVNKTPVTPPVEETPVDDPGEDDPEGAAPEPRTLGGDTPAPSGDEPASGIGEDPALAVNDSGEASNSNENDAVGSVDTRTGGSDFDNDDKTASTSGNSSINWLWWVLLSAGGIGLIGLATLIFLKRKKNLEGIEK